VPSCSLLLSELRCIIYNKLTHICKHKRLIFQLVAACLLNVVCTVLSCSSAALMGAGSVRTMRSYLFCFYDATRRQCHCYTQGVATNQAHNGEYRDLALPLYTGSVTPINTAIQMLCDKSHRNHIHCHNDCPEQDCAFYYTCPIQR